MKSDFEYGYIEICLDDYMTKHNISKNKLEARANLSRSQLLRYYNKKAQRVDLAVMSRICFALECDLSDIIKYCPPEAQRKTTVIL